MEQLELDELAAQGLGRIGFGLSLILVWPTEFAAMAGVALGCWVPVVIGWWALRRPRVDVPHSEGHPGLELLREVGTSSQALLAFFALSNVDILLARATMSDSEAGLYAAGLIMAKAILFLPQFVEARQGHVASQLLVLGLVLTAIAFVFHAGLGIASARARDWTSGRAAGVAWVDRLQAAVFLGIAARLVFLSPTGA